VPQPVRTLLQRCLIKDPRKRIADIAAAQFVLDPHTGAVVASNVSAALLPRKPLWRRIVAPTAGGLVVAVLAGALVWFSTRSAPPRVQRLTIAPAGTSALTISDLDRVLAITTDGTGVIYVGNNGTHFFSVRSISSNRERSPPAGGSAGSLCRPTASGSASWTAPRPSRKSRSLAGPP
jgi:hypothetical protein